MEHQCHDCSYRGKRLSHGTCPACGSANIGRPKGAESEAQTTSKKSTVIMLGLWVLLGYLLLEKFL